MTLMSPILPLPGDRAWLAEMLHRADSALARTPRFQRAVAGLSITEVIAQAQPIPPPCAELLYRAWLAAHPDGEDAAPAQFNLGVAMQQTGQFAAAAAAFGRAHQQRPDLWQAALARGTALEAAGNAEAALAVWQAALQPPEARRNLHVQLARLLEDQGQLGAAMDEARQALLIDPDQPDVLQHLIHNRQRTANWPPDSPDVPGLTADVAALWCGPLAALAMFDDPLLQTRAARDWLARKVPDQGPALAPAMGYDHKGIRLGFLSSDFCRHAMSFLVAELLEQIDRDAFTLFGYCTSPEDGSAIRQRVISAFDHYRPIRDIPDAAAAAMIRQDEIDVLIDLNGLTKGARLAILRRKPAPVQATYLGYIGPVPLPEMDYLICDDITVPPERENDYGLKPLRLAKCFQANDSHPPDLPVLSREGEGLPETGFVFACHSHHYKLTSAVFQAWCHIIRQVPGSVLWLIDDNPESRSALFARWIAAGLGAERLIFAPRTDPDRYRARLGLADLFLDTTPYNAGTIASDCLRMGTPVLTVLGQAFCARMAASLLNAVGLTECIASDLDDYVVRATQLAQDPARQARIRQALRDGAWRRGLGDGPAFARRFEDAIRRVVVRPTVVHAD
jgi:predicted O-linked N-acetylglucosamine transferase (SPINDLY family)